MVYMAASKKPDTEEVQKAKMAFLAAIGDLSWRLAAIFMVPVLIGYGIDQARGRGNAVVIGTAVGFVLSVIFIIKLGLEASKK